MKTAREVCSSSGEQIEGGESGHDFKSVKDVRWVLAHCCDHLRDTDVRTTGNANHIAVLGDDRITKIRTRFAHVDLLVVSDHSIQKLICFDYWDLVVRSPFDDWERPSRVS